MDFHFWGSKKQKSAKKARQNTFFKVFFKDPAEHWTKSETYQIWWIQLKWGGFSLLGVQKFTFGVLKKQKKCLKRPAKTLFSNFFSIFCRTLTQKGNLLNLANPAQMGLIFNFRGSKMTLKLTKSSVFWATVQNWLNIKMWDLFFRIPSCLTFLKRTISSLYLVICLT